jgi:hypothetical protein
MLSVFWGSGQLARRDRLECSIKKMKTYCMEAPGKNISEISFSNGLKFFGRYEDFKDEFSEYLIAMKKKDITCFYKDSIQYDEYGQSIIWSYNNKDSRPFYYSYSRRFSYKGTVKDIKFPGYYQYNPASQKNYLIFYSKERETDKNFEVFFNVFNGDDQLIYTFHQRENEFDEFTYHETEEDPFYKKTIYKNGKLFSETRIFRNYETGFKKNIRQYHRTESYVMNEKGVAVLIPSQFAEEKTDCNCSKGYVTKIRYKPEDACDRGIILD